MLHRVVIKTAKNIDKIYFSTVHISISDDIISLLFDDIKGLVCANQTRNILQATRGDAHHAVIFRAQKKRGENGAQQDAAADEPASPVFGQVCAAFFLSFSMRNN